MTKDMLQDEFLQRMLCEIEDRLQDLPNALNPYEYMRKEAEVNLLIELKDRYVKFLEDK